MSASFRKDGHSHIGKLVYYLYNYGHKIIPKIFIIFHSEMGARHSSPTGSFIGFTCRYSRFLFQTWWNALRIGGSCSPAGSVSISLREIETEPMKVISIIPIGNHKSFRFANHFHSEESIIFNFPVKVGQYHVLQHNAYLPFDRCPEGLRLHHTLSVQITCRRTPAGWRGFYFPLKAHNIVCSVADKAVFCS